MEGAAAFFSYVLGPMFVLEAGLLIGFTLLLEIRRVIHAGVRAVKK